LALLSRIIPLVLLHLVDLAPFDSSASIVCIQEPSPTLRWDAVHFSSVALHGYQYEQQLAFQPGWPLIMRLSGEVVKWAKNLMGRGDHPLGPEEVALGGILVANLAFIGSSVMLYK
jgi:phosphatidylinositol glycan class V